MATRMYKRPNPNIRRRPPLMIQNGGLSIPAIIAGLSATHKGLQILKPATKAKRVYDQSKFGKSGSLFSKIVGKVLDAGKSIGYGPVVVVRAAPKRKKAKVGGRKKK